MNNFDTVREALKEAIFWEGQGQHPSRIALDKALTALTALEADHFSAADMASAAAQGHRDGVASVTQGEPFGYFRPEPFGWTDCAETDEGAIALYAAAPVAQQPQTNRAQKMKDAGFTRRPSLREFPRDGDDEQPQAGYTSYTRTGDEHITLHFDSEAAADAWQDAADRAAPVAQQPQAEAVVGTKTWYEDGKMVTQHLTAADIYKPEHQQAEAVPLLTEQEVDSVWDAIPQTQFWWRRYARAIEQAVRAKMGAAVPMTLEQIIRMTDEIPLRDGCYVQVARVVEKFHGIVGKEGA